VNIQSTDIFKTIIIIIIIIIITFIITNIIGTFWITDLGHYFFITQENRLVILDVHRTLLFGTHFLQF
jgi:hypothetical protein